MSTYQTGFLFNQIRADLTELKRTEDGNIMDWWFFFCKNKKDFVRTGRFARENDKKNSCR